jgi:predicted transcriptional regulator
LEEHWLPVKASADGEYLRYYPDAMMGDQEKRVLELARQSTVRHILLHLLRRNNCNHKQLVRTIQLSPSTITWHLNKLVDSQVIEKEARGRKSFYSINDSTLVKMVITKYRESFKDALVDRFIDMWKM